MYIDNVIIELTRECNMLCQHCLRGNAEHSLISEKSLENFFSQVDGIETLSLTGGEVSLAAKQINMLVQAAKNNKIEAKSLQAYHEELKEKV